MSKYAAIEMVFNIIESYKEAAGITAPLTAQQLKAVLQDFKGWLDRKLEVDEELTEENFMVFLQGRQGSFRCDCGANVFKKPVGSPEKFVCNGCGTRWTGEKDV